MNPRRVCLIVLILFWCAWLVVQRGDPFDESEHAHVAWLMAQGKVPIRDFFQHHQPILWDMLLPYYLAGMPGPEGLYYGRGLVVVSAIVCAVCLLRLGRGGVTGLLTLIGVSLAFPTFLVARPETPALALYFAAVLLWHSAPNRRLISFLTGVLFGAAVFATPRFALLVGTFLLLPALPGRLFFLRLGLLSMFALGVLAFAGGYILLRPYPLANVLFNLEASSLLARIGPGYFDEATMMLATGMACVLIGKWFRDQLPSNQRRRFWLHAGYLLLVVTASLAATWPYLYPQNLFAPVAWLCVIFSTAQGSFKEKAYTPHVLVAGATACAVAIILGFMLEKNLPKVVARKHEVLALVQTTPSATVLVSAANHPLAAHDASFYVNPITDAKGRLSQSVRRLQGRWAAPPCDYFADVDWRSDLVIDGFVLELVLSDRGERPLHLLPIKKIPPEKNQGEAWELYRLRRWDAVSGER